MLFSLEFKLKMGNCREVIDFLDFFLDIDFLDLMDFLYK